MIFRAHCPARQLYVLVRARPGRFFTLTQIEPLAQDQWQVALPLPPGSYRYRYYADYYGPGAAVSPAEVEAITPKSRRFDAVFNVPDLTSAGAGSGLLPAGRRC